MVGVSLGRGGTRSVGVGIGTCARGISPPPSGSGPSESIPRVLIFPVSRAQSPIVLMSVPRQVDLTGATLRHGTL